MRYGCILCTRRQDNVKLIVHPYPMPGTRKLMSLNIQSRKLINGVDVLFPRWGTELDGIDRRLAGLLDVFHGGVERVYREHLERKSIRLRSARRITVIQLDDFVPGFRKSSNCFIQGTLDRGVEREYWIFGENSYLQRALTEFFDIFTRCRNPWNRICAAVVLGRIGVKNGFEEKFKVWKGIGQRSCTRNEPWNAVESRRDLATKWNTICGWFEAVNTAAQRGNADGAGDVGTYTEWRSSKCNKRTLPST